MPNIGPSPGNPSEEWEEGLLEPGVRDTGEKPIEMDSLANGNLQSLNQQAGCSMGLTCTLCIYSMVYLWSFE